MDNIQINLEIAHSEDDYGKAGRLTESLKNSLSEISNWKIRQVRAEHNTQDLGNALVLILQTTSVALLAKGISDWIASKPDAKITIRDDCGEIIISGARSKDLEKILETWSKKRKKI